MERENCLARCLYFRHPRIQPCHLGGVEERDRFSLSRMEQQSGRICGIWRRWRCPSGGELEVVMGEIKVADVRAQVALSMWTDFENFTTFKPHEQHDKAVHAMADEVIAWGEALKGLRATH